MNLSRVSKRVNTSLFYNQKRTIYPPFLIFGGVLNFYSWTHRWNPYIPRGELLTIQKIGVVFTITGLIIPS